MGGKIQRPLPIILTGGEGFARKGGNVRVVLVQGILGGVGGEERRKKVNEEEERVAVGIGRRRGLLELGRGEGSVESNGDKELR